MPSSACVKCYSCGHVVAFPPVSCMKWEFVCWCSCGVLALLMELDFLWGEFHNSINSLTVCSELLQHFFYQCVWLPPGTMIWTKHHFLPQYFPLTLTSIGLLRLMCSIFCPCVWFDYKCSFYGIECSSSAQPYLPVVPLSCSSHKLMLPLHVLNLESICFTHSKLISTLFWPLHVHCLLYCQRSDACVLVPPCSDPRWGRGQETPGEGTYHQPNPMLLIL